VTDPSISPTDVLAAQGVALRDSVPWGVKIRHALPGVYIVALHRDPADGTGTTTAPIDPAAIREWTMRVPALRLRGQPVSADALTAHISRWWLPATSVLYIGKAGPSNPLSKRVHQFVKTPIGAAGPHRGGQWLKTLRNLPGLTVHYALLPDEWATAELVKDAMLDWFVRNYPPVPPAHPSPALPLPWANLVLDRPLPRRSRDHGIKPSTL
jgi:hypothetical protein